MKVGISIGDINGIGPEVILKSLSHPKILNYITPIIYGSNKVMSYHKNIIKNSDVSFVNSSGAERAQKHKINVINCWNDNANIDLGVATPDGGKFAHIALDRAVQELKEHKLDALVTAPINKNVMNRDSFPFQGHTEYLTSMFNVQESLMMMVAENLRIGLVTNHLPVSEVAEAITKEKIIEKVDIFYNSLKRDFGIEKPTIAILGLNPHAGDEGKIGSEEIDIIRPVIIELKKKSKLVFGPYSADGFFGSGEYRKFDGILAMYHDQGLIPFKTLSFGTGINYTAGLPFVRTSPDHGTAYNIAGQNMADETSMRNAIFLAKDILYQRRDDDDMRKNAVEKKPKPTEEVQE